MRKKSRYGTSCLPFILLLFLALLLGACTELTGESYPFGSKESEAELTRETEATKTTETFPVAEGAFEAGEMTLPLLPVAVDRQLLIPICPAEKWGAINEHGDLVYDFVYDGILCLGESPFYLLGQRVDGDVLYAIGDDGGNVLSDFCFTMGRENAEDRLLFLQMIDVWEPPEQTLWGVYYDSTCVVIDKDSGEFLLDGRDFDYGLQTISLFETTSYEGLLPMFDQKAEKLLIYEIASLRARDTVPVREIGDMGSMPYPVNGSRFLVVYDNYEGEGTSYLIDLAGDVYDIPSQYSDFMPDEDTGFIGYDGEYYIYLDKDMNPRFSGNFISASPFENDVAIVCYEDIIGAYDYGLIDRQGKRITNQRYVLMYREGEYIYAESPDGTISKWDREGKESVLEKPPVGLSNIDYSWYEELKEDLILYSGNTYDDESYLGVWDAKKKEWVLPLMEIFWSYKMEGYTFVVRPAYSNSSTELWDIIDSNGQVILESYKIFTDSMRPGYFAGVKGFSYIVTNDKNEIIYETSAFWGMDE